MYVLELAGDRDPFARREAATVAGQVDPFAGGLALARGLDGPRVRGLAYTRRANELVGYTEATIDGARTLLEAASIDRTGTVAVRARDVRGTTGIDTQRVERALGTVLVDRGFAVDLDSPDHELRALFAGSCADGSKGAAIGVGDDSTNERCALGWLAVESTRDFGRRIPTEKPFFQPGSMDPLLARALANLAGAGPGRVIADPMCGTGGILVEAGLVGSRVLGLDAQDKMVRGARTNLRAYLGSPIAESHPEFAVIQGEATRVPLRDGSIDGICFDAPYGRQSKIEGDRTALVAGALREARRLADRTVIVADRPWVDAAREAGWAIESRFEHRVHRSLTRHIAVLDAD